MTTLNKNLTLTIIAFLFAAITISKAEEIKINKIDMDSINLTASYGYFTIIELENEILNTSELNTKGLSIKKLNNKSIMISVYDDNLPTNLGKLVINDAACNTYSIKITKGRQNKDNVVYITNSDKTKTCESIDKQKGLVNRTILYSRNMQQQK